MTEQPSEPSARVRAAVKVLHDYGTRHRWVSRHYAKTYEELEATGPIGFGEFNDLIAEALDAADAACR